MERMVTIIKIKVNPVSEKFLHLRVVQVNMAKEHIIVGENLEIVEEERIMVINTACGTC